MKTKYAKIHFETADLEELLKDYYGDDFTLNSEQLHEIMMKVESQLIDDLSQEGNERLQAMAVRLIEEKQV